MLNRHIVLAANPVGWPKLSDFETKTAQFDLQTAGNDPDHVLVLETLYISMDPYMRGRMRPGVPPPRPTLYSPFELNKTIEGYGVSRVLKSKFPEKYPPGSFVTSISTAWADYQILRQDELTLLEETRMIVSIPADEEEKLHIPLSHYVGPLGSPGVTGYVGFFKFGQPQPGETIFVSGAAGAVGQSVCLLAKRAGLRVVGSAGSDDKVRFLKEKIKIDAAFNYKKPVGGSLDTALAQLCPSGIDIYFDNVGGETLDAAIAHANENARFPLCGRISQINTAEADQYQLKNEDVARAKSISLSPFGVSADRPKLLDSIYGVVKPQITAGEWREFKEDVRVGLDAAPSYFIEMMRGSNFGKSIIEVKNPKAESVISKL
ncbi:NAD(P)-binding protein [Gonapodya prolifera JEL478]|uniref:NAD(P)-binding protein n=1 Tax=Gonapodya prolifera (strain JEL478) TaxID=1344416 RepID=A0A139AU01_GONPJ|nr:NAD(P)-binding protein [Gonapodya prolifera JEL478]|eukprot:KXS20212.1 NAD(P)-binding protein [Gonapodya prolifera JEL478]